MEPVGRNYCIKRLTEIKEEINDYAYKKIPDITIIKIILSVAAVWLVITSITWILIVAKTQEPLWFLGFVFTTLVYFSVIPVLKKIRLKRERAKQELLLFHPKYAEILERAKSTDAESYGEQKEKK